MVYKAIKGTSRSFHRLGQCFSVCHSTSVRLSSSSSEPKSSYDAVIIGAGHNGLVSATYLQKAGLKVCVLERRHVIGGAAVTEEIFPGFKFSRAAYVLGLMRPQIIQDLELKKYGLKVYLRDLNSYTPLIEPGGKSGKARSLLLQRDSEKTKMSIAQFSEKDAQVYSEFGEQLTRIIDAILPLIDNPPIYVPQLFTSSVKDKWESMRSFKHLFSTAKTLGADFPGFYELMTAPVEKILNRWFESEPLRATLATGSVIGAMMSPKTPGSGYVLPHHMMGELEGVKGACGYVEGGMGNLSRSIANCAQDHGADIFTSKPISEIVVNNDQTTGVVLEDGTEVKAKLVLSNATPKVTYLDLLPQGTLPQNIEHELKGYSFDSPVTKINAALDKIPNFLADPNIKENEPMPHHQCTIHLNCEHSDIIHEGFVDAQAGLPSSRPLIEMVLPSSLDPTVAPPGCHVLSMFTQFTPYKRSDGREWDDETKNEYADRVFDTVEKYAPGFKASVVGRDILTPPDLERIIGLTGGNIFHGAMSLDQLYMTRPITAFANYRCPVKGLYLCGSGAHPGGGVMGLAGKLASQAALSDFRS